MTNSENTKPDWPGGEARLEDSALLDVNEVMTRLYRESRRGAADLQATPRETPARFRPRPGPAASRRVALPPPPAESRPLQEALLARGAVRVYDEAPIGLAQLGAILRVASEGDRQDWPREEEAGVGLQLLVVAWRVEELEPAVWRYEPATHELSYVGPAPGREDASSLTLQVEFSAAPALVFVSGGLAAACARYGSWGHRQLLLRGGAAGQRLWLGAIGVGLVGTVFAGFLPRAANRFANVDGYRQAGLIAFAVGRLPRFVTGAGDDLPQTGAGGYSPAGERP
jgi:nitroreductase